MDGGGVEGVSSLRPAELRHSPLPIYTVNSMIVIILRFAVMPCAKKRVDRCLPSLPAADWRISFGLRPL